MLLKVTYFVLHTLDTHTNNPIIIHKQMAASTAAQNASLPARVATCVSSGRYSDATAQACCALRSFRSASRQSRREHRHAARAPTRGASTDTRREHRPGSRVGDTGGSGAGGGARQPRGFVAFRESVASSVCQPSQRPNLPRCKGCTLPPVTHTSRVTPKAQ
jgi:hypothetical protein